MGFGSSLMYELACELKDRDHEINVLTTIPQYNIPLDSKDIAINEVMS